MIAIHQPNYLPWLGFFDKARLADTFVLLDNVSYTRGSVINRNKIKTKKGWEWLTVPVRNIAGTIIRDVTTVDSGWEKTHWKTLTFNYSKASHFKDFVSSLQEIYENRWVNLAELNETLIRMIFDWFDMHPNMVRASDLSVQGSSSELLVSICKTLGDRTYLSGVGAKDYLNQSVFEREGVTVKFQDFASPRYNQLFGEFIPALSVIDYLFNCGRTEWWR